MVSLWILRRYGCYALSSVFGYFLPGINSMKAILTEDEDSINEFLTYWSVLTILSYFEYFLNILNAFKNHPPEFKVLFILWLTLPRFQGAYRLYTFIVKPYFEKYEDDIDKHISHVTERVKVSATKQVQRLFWHLFLEPNDGLISMSTFHSFGMLAASVPMLRPFYDQTAFRKLGSNPSDADSYSEHSREEMYYKSNKADHRESNKHHTHFTIRNVRMPPNKPSRKKATNTGNNHVDPDIKESHSNNRRKKMKRKKIVLPMDLITKKDAATVELL